MVAEGLNVICAVQAEHARWLREVAVVADEDADPADPRAEDRVADVARLEEVPLREDRPDLRDVRLSVLAEHRAVGVDHRRGVVEDALQLLLEERHDEHHLVLPRELANGLDRGAVVGLRREEPVRLLLRAEGRAEEDLLQARDLGAARGRLLDHLHVLGERLLLGQVCVRLHERRPNRLLHRSSPPVSVARRFSHRRSVR